MHTTQTNPPRKRMGNFRKPCEKETCSKPLLPRLQNGSHSLPQRERASLFFRSVSIHSAKEKHDVFSESFHDVYRLNFSKILYSISLFFSVYEVIRMAIYCELIKREFCYLIGQEAVSSQYIGLQGVWTGQCSNTVNKALTE